MRSSATNRDAGGAGDECRAWRRNSPSPANTYRGQRLVGLRHAFSRTPRPGGERKDRSELAKGAPAEAGDTRADLADPPVTNGQVNFGDALAAPDGNRLARDRRSLAGFEVCLRG